MHRHLQQWAEQSPFWAVLVLFRCRGPNRPNEPIWKKRLVWPRGLPLLGTTSHMLVQVHPGFPCRFAVLRPRGLPGKRVPLNIGWFLKPDIPKGKGVDTGLFCEGKLLAAP